MFKALRASKDAYVTNRFVDEESHVYANVGDGGSIDIFKLYGFTSTVTGSTDTPNTELSRAFIKFDLSPLRALQSAGKIDTNNRSFNCRLYLYDVYGGQPTPDNFTIVVNPLSRSFDEGRGRDVVLYSDYDVCNWLTASLVGGAWFSTGCGAAGDGTTASDYLTGTSGMNLTSTQTFTTGEEDMNIDVTTIVSATLANLIPDQGFRIALSEQLETDQHTYFVKRFGSRTAYNASKRPKLLIRFDDSIQDDTNDMYLDATGSVFLRNYVRSVPTNLTSGSTHVTGVASVLLQLITPVSGGLYALYFTGSQHYSGLNPQPGLYSASVAVSSLDVQLSPQWRASGSITFTPVWSTLDRVVPYVTGSTFKVFPPQRGTVSLEPRRLTVTTVGIKEQVGPDQQFIVRVNIFDETSPYVTRAVRLPVLTPGKVIRDVHYQIRDVVTNELVIPYDTTHNSTRLSNDTSGMYFRLDTANLTSGRSYSIDIITVTADDTQTYEGVSPSFRVGALA